MKDQLFLDEIRRIPSFIEPALDELGQQTAEILNPSNSGDPQQVYLVGCGDSYHAGLCAEFYFQIVAGVRCRAMSSMAFSRYETAVSRSISDKDLLVAVSSSGRVGRTVESVILAKKRGMRTLAITGDPNSPLADVADLLLLVPLNEQKFVDPNVVLPGSRSFVASLLALYSTALQLGEISGYLNQNSIKRKIDELRKFGAYIDESIKLSEPEIRETALQWRAANHLVFCGSGPNYGSAQFSAAKTIEAAGSPALGQDTEEWAHLQYFEKVRGTPTIIITAGGRDADRAEEILAAAEAVGCSVALVAPLNDMRLGGRVEQKYFPVHGPVNEEVSPLVTTVPGMLLGAYLSYFLNETYFRAFRGGRSIEGGGGISKIQSSHLIEDPPE